MTRIKTVRAVQRQDNYKPRMRLIKEAAAELKERDPETALTEYALRRMVKTGQVPSVNVGNRYLVNMAVLERFLCGQ